MSAVLTSASVHDSQGSIPLAQLSAQRVTALYALMDRAYDAPQSAASPGLCRSSRRIRAAAKVMCHLMLGVVALTTTTLFARLC